MYVHIKEKFEILNNNFNLIQIIINKKQSYENMNMTYFAIKNIELIYTTHNKLFNCNKLFLIIMIK